MLLYYVIFWMLDLPFPGLTQKLIPSAVNSV